MLGTFVLAALVVLPTRTVAQQDRLGTSRTLVVGTRGGGEVGLKTYPRTLALADREVVLTFDDGPWPGTTGKVLDILKANDVKATFFLIGRNAAAHPELVRREWAEGHTVAHHTWSHPGVTLRGLPDAAARLDIDRGIEAVEKAVGGESSGASVPRVGFFRFPGFADTPALREWLASRDIVVFGADLWASDWLPMAPEEQLSLVMTRLRKAGKGIVLFHDTRHQTVAMLQDFLSDLKKEGFRVVHVVPGPGALETVPAPPGWTSQTEQSLAAIMPHLLAGHRRAPDRPAVPLDADPSAARPAGAVQSP